MEKKSLSRKTIFIITGAVFTVLTLLIAVASLFLERYSSGRANSVSSAEMSQEFYSNNSSGINSFGSEAVSQTFAEIESSSDLSDFSSDNLSTSEESDAAVEINHGWVINEYGYTYLYGNSGYEQFNYKASAMQRYINCLNKFASKIPEETKIINITVPVSSTFADIPRDIYVADSFFNQSQSAFISTVGTKLDDRIANLNIVSEIEERYNNGEYIFFRTDKNWTPLGAYSAYKAFCEQKEIEPLPIDSFYEIEVGNYLGSFYNATADLLMERNPDNFKYFLNHESVTTDLTVYDGDIVFTEYELCNNDITDENAYDIILGRNAGRYEINTTAKGNALLIIGDSSAAPILPFLATHYSKIDFINPELYSGSISEFLGIHQYSDVLVMCYSTNAVNGNYIPAFNNLNGV